MLLKNFFTAHDAAQWLAQKSGEPMQADDVHQRAESGVLPVCFAFQGDLGVFDRAPPVAQVFHPPKRRTYFPRGYLRARGGVDLRVFVECLRGPRRVVDVLRAQPVEIVQPGRGFDRIAACDPPGEGEIWWRLARSGSGASLRFLRDHAWAVPSSEWLFHVGDLDQLIADRAPETKPDDSRDRKAVVHGLAPNGSEGTSDAPVGEQRPAVTGPKFSMNKAALVAAHKHEWPTIEGDIKHASSNGLADAKALKGRDWNEEVAMLWAASKGKLKTAQKSSDPLFQATHNMGSLPSRKHTLKG